MSPENRWLTLALICMGAAIVLLFLIPFPPSFGAHPAEHQAIHNRFYKTWMMPDAPKTSCCDDQDCEPVPSKFVGGKWYGFKDDWIEIPPNKVERGVDSPDGRSHMCGRKGYLGGYTVFCFIAGTGG